ncbi:amino acid ABC transporter substrate-binding protein (PAAT family) [Jatrophihabitans sp. GAS493]|uniref:ABC transporter substrate-binding protein n=1 Tax=Jatrophihabitans sp. GAS493 TaxID=1907575 RepID=UPI000BB8EFBA|nr:ABC transporter substrate-binding protein [Jatrophihabitans sp. GAS493]SOD70361.1 amino acid ABC transporter substrate-binding protein (PAAT family) [Jatrophihabitans sp. GAS493]
MVFNRTFNQTYKPAASRGIRGRKSIAAVALSLTLAVVVSGCSSSASTGAAAAGTSAASTVSAACAAVQKQYPDLAKKTVKVGIAPTIPGYETIDPNNPEKIVGFDVDLLSAVSACAGYKTTFAKADFQTLVPSLQAGRIDMVISNLIASDARAKQVNFVIYQKDEEALIVAKGNPKNITEVSDLCGKSLAVFPGTVQAGAAQTQSDACKAAGKPAIDINTYADFNGCLQGVLNGRSDSFINPTSVVAQTVAKYPTKLSGTAPIAEFRSLIGMAFNKSDTELRDANLAALKVVQTDGTEKALFTTWKQDPTDQADASLLPQ